jgi:hypothetical protein
MISLFVTNSHLYSKHALSAKTSEKEKYFRRDKSRGTSKEPVRELYRMVENGRWMVDFTDEW